MIMLQKITTTPQNIATVTRSIKTMTRKKNIELKTKKEKSVIILGDSIVKYVNGWDMSKRLTQCKVYVKRFPGAEKAMHERLFETFATSKSKSFHLTRQDQRPEI